MSDDFLDTDENTALEDSPQTSEFDDLIGYIDKNIHQLSLLDIMMRHDGYSRTETIEVSMVLM